MRHNVSILLGEDLKQFASRLSKYIYKYGEGKAEEFCSVSSWTKLADASVEIKKAVLDLSSNGEFVSTTQDLYSTRLVDDIVLASENNEQEMHRYFTKLHQQTITINKGGDSNSLLLTLYLPLYDAELCQQVVDVVRVVSGLQAHYSLMVVGLCYDLRYLLHPEADDDKITPEQEKQYKRIQKQSIGILSDLRLETNSLQQVVVIQNINAAGYSLDLDEDSFIRVLGELSLLTVEKFDTVFTQTASFDREHPMCSLGLSVINLDKYYFTNYILRRSYLHILEKEGVGTDKVDLNKVALIAQNHMQQHQRFFSDFYTANIEPLVKAGVSHNDIISQTSPKLQEEFEKIKSHLTDYINSDDLTLPEKKALLAVIMGYDDALLRGNLFNQEQLTLDNLDEEVANIFISANNDLVETKVDKDGKKTIVKGPITVCSDENGIVTLPIKRLQQLRNDMRESTNYIRQKNDELKDIEEMTENATESEKRFTEQGFVVDGNVYHFDVDHQEVSFDETYVPKAVTEKSVDLRDNFTPIKDQGQIGACTVFSIASIFEYILKKNSKEIYDLSESFVYYNVRHAEGEEKNDTGSSFQDVIRIMGTDGICTEELHPYSKKLSDVPSEDAYADGKKRKIIKALNVEVSEDAIKSAVQEGYPVAISLKVYNSFSTTTFGGKGSHVGSSGFVSYPSDEEIASDEYGYHAMVIVGYTNETKHFVVRNSWGKNFGDKGYCYIPYSYICDKDLNRMACIVTEVDISDEVKTVVEGRGGSNTIVEFNMNDAVIKSYVIKNLLDAEQRRLDQMQKENIALRHNYETLMQELGRQPKRNDILKRKQNKLQEGIETAKAEQRRINETERSQRLNAFDSQTIKVRMFLVVWDILFFIFWGLGVYIYAGKAEEEGKTFFQEFIDWCSSTMGIIVLILFVAGIILTVLYWWWIKGERRRIELELEEKSAQEANKAHKLQEILDVSRLKFHIAGMIIDDLLSLKTTLDQKYQAMKSYIGNLAIWQKEEEVASETMEPLVKNPFIPLLNNKTLDTYFRQNVDEITDSLHLYEYFNGYQLDDEAIIAYKRQLKQNVLDHVKTLLENFTIFRHVFQTKIYPYLDNEYASADNLLPLLDRKSEPFCQIKNNAMIMPQARYLFVHTDAKEKYAWCNTYPKFFTSTPISEDICSVYKIVALRLQPLSVDEILMEE